MKRWPPRPRTRAGLLALGAALGVALALFLVLRGGGSEDVNAAPAAGGRQVAARFAALSAAHSNSCGMDAAALRSMPDRMHLRGSCCFPMDRARYAQQLHGVRDFGDGRLVPADPYDVPVALAKRLLDYRRIDLRPAQQAAYRKASDMADTGGPCCCPCWRWQAFKGQARLLIVRRGYTAERIASLWDLEEGCGGPADET